MMHPSATSPSPTATPVPLEWPMETAYYLSGEVLDQDNKNGKPKSSENLKMSNGYGLPETKGKKLKRRKRGVCSRANKVPRTMDNKEPTGVWAKKVFRGLSMTQINEIESKRQAARAARAAEQNFLCDEQRFVMENFENENPYGNSSDYEMETENPFEPEGLGKWGEDLGDGNGWFRNVCEWLMAGEIEDEKGQDTSPSSSWSTTASQGSPAVSPLPSMLPEDLLTMDDMEN